MIWNGYKYHWCYLFHYQFVDMSFILNAYHISSRNTCECGQFTKICHFVCNISSSSFFTMKLHETVILSAKLEKRIWNELSDRNFKLYCSNHLVSELRILYISTNFLWKTPFLSKVPANMHKFIEIYVNSWQNG